MNVLFVGAKRRKLTEAASTCVVMVPASQSRQQRRAPLTGKAAGTQRPGVPHTGTTPCWSQDRALALSTPQAGVLPTLPEWETLAQHVPVLWGSQAL